MDISIHALREEGDSLASASTRAQINFYPRPPRGGRRVVQDRGGAIKDFYPRPPRGGRRLLPDCRSVRSLFLSTPSARRATRGGRRVPCPGPISIHALREEGDGRRRPVLRRDHYFYPRPPRGGRRPASSLSDGPFRFLSTPSARRATLFCQRGPQHLVISIHALREEGDAVLIGARGAVGLFLSTPSARRATYSAIHGAPPESISIHALREEGDWRARSFALMMQISIHALREEGDRRRTGPDRQGKDFYPRPPRGGRLWRFRMPGTRCSYFYPRPPRGGRRYIHRNSDWTEEISIHALREEGDPQGSFFWARPHRFLSTPSARRATTRPRSFAAAGGKFLSTPSARRATPLRCP